MAPPTSSGGIGRLFTYLAIFFGLITPVFYLLDKNLDKFYIFDLDEMHAISIRAVAQHGNNTTEMVNYIVKELHDRYPDHINLNEDDWFFNNAGGAMGGVRLLHSSITEYMIIFGTTIGTEGHTGRHTADDYFHILVGEEHAYSLGTYEPEIYPPGSMHHLRRGQVKQYRMPNGCFALEYARGWIPPMLFFGFADGLFSTLDFPTLWRTTRITGREMISELLKGKL